LVIKIEIGSYLEQNLRYYGNGKRKTEEICSEDEARHKDEANETSKKVA
jgi:hypothetical protein